MSVFVHPECQVSESPYEEKAYHSPRPGKVGHKNIYQDNYNPLSRARPECDFVRLDTAISGVK